MALLTAADIAYLDEELASHESRYLTGINAREQSGFGRNEADWRRYREIVLAPVETDGTFLDIGCANGLLMESVAAWSAERGIKLEPFGIDISARLATLARQRLPHWRNRIFVGNALGWRPPRTFDYVRTEIVYAPPARRRDLVAHLLAHVVAPGGRLIVVSYGSSRPDGVRAETLVEELRGWDFPITRVDDTVSVAHGFIVTRAVTIAVNEGRPTGW